MTKSNKITGIILFILCLCTGILKAQPVISGNTCIAASNNVTASTLPAPTCGTTGYAYTVSNTTGLSNFTWTVKGDLEIVSGGTAGSTSICVRSKNVGRKVDCNGYLIQTGTNAYGYGKGRIYFNYTTGANCGQRVQLDLNKTFSEHPPIVGPACVSVGDTVTYSVCPILSVNQADEIGQDKYYWTTYKSIPTSTAPNYDVLPNGTTYTGVPTGFEEIYRSSDGSSITFKVNAGYTGGTLKCRFGQCNANGTGTESSYTLGLKATKPTVTVNTAAYAFGNTACIATNVSSIPLTANVSGTWTTDNPAWTFGTTNATTTTGTSVSLNIGQSTGKVFLTTVGNCPILPRIDTIIISRNMGAPFSITTSSTCITPNSSVNFTLAGGNVSGSKILWSFNPNPSPGWSQTAGGNGSVITVTAGTGATSIVASFSGCSSSISLPVALQPAAPTAVTVSPSCIIAGTPTSGGTSCQTVTLTASGGSNHEWTLPAGLKCATTCTMTGNPITFTIFGTPGTYNVTVKSLNPTNAACSSAVITKQVIVGAAPTLSKTSEFDNDNLAVSAPPAGCVPAYLWFRNGAATTYTNRTLQLVNGGPASFTVRVTYPCGAVYNLGPVNTNFSAAARPVNSTTTDIVKDDNTLYPNPAGKLVNLRLSSTKGGVHIIITDSKGVQVYSKLQKTSSAAINTAQWSNGVYTVTLVDNKGERTVKKLVISK